jgi:Flp pilus assembly protein TadG
MIRSIPIRAHGQSPDDCGGEQGSELIEMAIVLPIFIILIMGIIDFGFLFQRYEVVVNAARESARLATAGTFSNAAAETRALNYLASAGLTGTADADVTDTSMTVDGVVVNTKTATVVYPSSFIFLPGSVDLRGVAVMRVQ